MQLKEEDIRPEGLKKGQEERFAADVRRLLERRDAFVEVPCPACRDEGGRVDFEKSGFSYKRCSRCSTLFVSPRPTPAVLEDYYATSENYAYWNRFIFPASEPQRRDRIFRPRAQRVVEACLCHGIPDRSLVEVGAGFGTFCEEVRRLAFFERILAIEPTPGLAATCRGRGLEVIEAPFERAALVPASAGVIASFEVIEHLFSPRLFLEACHEVLAENGILVLSCPNGLGFEVATLGPLSDTVDAEHLNYFNPESLALLCESIGFSVLEVRTPGELDAELVRKKALLGSLDLRDQPFLRRVLLDDWERMGQPFQEYLAGNQLSSHMWLVARRKQWRAGQ